MSLCGWSIARIRHLPPLHRCVAPSSGSVHRQSDLATRPELCHDRVPVIHRAHRLPIDLEIASPGLRPARSARLPLAISVVTTPSVELNPNWYPMVCVIGPTVMPKYGDGVKSCNHTLPSSQTVRISLAALPLCAQFARRDVDPGARLLIPHRLASRASPLARMGGARRSGSANPRRAALPWVVPRMCRPACRLPLSRRLTCGSGRDILGIESNP